MTNITPHRAIPEQEFSFTFSRSSGPGGQNVNKVNTRVTLIFNLVDSPSLSPEEKERITEKLATRINKLGQLRITSYRHRTQGANREAAIDRFFELISEALTVRKSRKKTTVSKGAKERRLNTKKKRGLLKKNRRTLSD